MAGYMYLGNKKVCPAILVGNTEQQILPIFDVDSNGKLIPKSNFDGSGIIKIQGMFSNIIRKDFFQNTIESFNFPDLEEIDSYTFNGFLSYTTVVSANFQKLKVIPEGGFADLFSSCPSFNSIDLSSVEEIKEYGLYNCFSENSITSIRFQKLVSLENFFAESAFWHCNLLKDIYFDSVTNQSFVGTSHYEFYDLLDGVDGCTLHFPSNVTIISSLYGYPNFGGTNTVILYDLPETGN